MSAPTSMIARGRMALFGWQPLYRRPVRRRVLAALDRFPAIALERWGLGDRPAEPLDPARLGTEPLGPGPVAMELLRDAHPRWIALVSLDDLAWMSATIAGSELADMGAETWFSLAEALVDALEPDIAFAHLDGDLPSLPDAERARRARIDGGVTTGNDYYEHGPGGLGMRTWLGPRVLRTLGADRVRALPPPAIVSSTAWGGLRVDLVAEPWHADPRALADAFDAAMSALAPAGFFARWRGSGGRRPAWERSAGVDLGGVARESALGLRLERDARERGPAAGEPEPDPAPLIEAARSRRRVEDITLSWANLRGADLRHLEADTLVLSWAELTDARLDGAHIESGELDSTELERACFDGARLVSCTFTRALGPGASFRGSHIEGTGFEQAVLEGADLSSARIEEGYFDQATLRGASFAGATIERTSFRMADCSGVSFAGAVLRDVDTEGASFGGADFTGATLTGVDLSCVQPVSDPGSSAGSRSDSVFLSHRWGEDSE